MSAPAAESSRDTALLLSELGTLFERQLAWSQEEAARVLALLEVPKKQGFDRLAETSAALVDFARRKGDTLLEGKAMRHLAHCFSRQGRFEEAIQIARDALDVLQPHDAAREVMHLHNLIGASGLDLGHFSDSVRHFHQALEIAKSLDDRLMHWRLLNNLGVIHYSNGDLITALGHHLRAAAVVDLGRPQDSATTQLNIGHLLLDAGLPARARSHLETALRLARESSELFLQANALQSLARTLLALGDAATGSVTAHEGVCLAEREGLHHELGSLLCERARCHAASGEAMAAAADFSKSFGVASSFGASTREAEIAVAWADFLTSDTARRAGQADLVRARRLLARARELLDQTESLTSLVDFHLAASHLAEASGDAVTALSELREWKRLREQLHTASIEVQMDSARH